VEELIDNPAFSQRLQEVLCPLPDASDPKAWKADPHIHSRADKEGFRRRAAEARAMAEKFRDPAVKEGMLNIAAMYDRLADGAEWHPHTARRQTPPIQHEDREVTDH
jgi:hypothetical protein